MNFELYKSQMLALGYDEVIQRKWAPYVVVPEHAHPFAVNALMVEGEMSLRVGAITRRLRAGDTFELRAGELHEESYSAEGATYWIARRKPAGG